MDTGCLSNTPPLGGETFPAGFTRGCKRIAPRDALSIPLSAAAVKGETKKDWRCGEYPERQRAIAQNVKFCVVAGGSEATVSNCAKLTFCVVATRPTGGEKARRNDGARAAARHADRQGSAAKGARGRSPRAGLSLS